MGLFKRNKTSINSLNQCVLVLALFCVAITSYAQYNIGHTTITFNDPARTGGVGNSGQPGRQIQTEIYYPASIAGEHVTPEAGQFPIVVFGHGFAMSWDAYQNIWEGLVPEGFIVAFPRTEESLMPGPEHAEFGLDLALVETEIRNEGDNAQSLLYNCVANKSAIMGHSMGGGASFLAAANNNSIATVIGLAPAETDPSAITQAPNVSVPALILSADEDLVTPAADHHIPIYNGLNSSCKYFININGGAHCYYANENFYCDFGETSSGGNITITRAQQQVIMFRYLIPWLRIYLYDDCDQFTVFENDLAQDTEVTFQSACSGFPSPNYDLSVTVNGNTLTSAENNAVYQWVDCDNGYAPIAGANSQDFTATQNGNYAVVLGTGSCAETSACNSIANVGIEEYENPNKKLIKVVDLLGRETNVQNNQPLIYIYDDGSRECIMKIANQ